MSSMACDGGDGCKDQTRERNPFQVLKKKEQMSKNIPLYSIARDI